jgi:hypothetical protein
MIIDIVMFLPLHLQPWPAGMERETEIYIIATMVMIIRLWDSLRQPSFVVVHVDGVTMVISWWTTALDHQSWVG